MREFLFNYDCESEKSTVSEIFHGLRVRRGPKWPDRFGKALKGWFKENSKRPIQTLSLFSGAGGLDIGFHDAGFGIHTLVEIEEKFSRTLKINTGKDRYFSNCDIQCIDIRDYEPKKNMAVDFVIGGPPCQTFSAAGRRAAGVQGIDEERGTLFEEYVRILKRVKPKGFLFENVYGMTGAQNGNAWSEITQAFEEAGYHIEHRILDAADYGVPQHRERVFIIGTRSEPFLFPRPTHGPDSPGNEPYITAAQALEKLSPVKGDLPNGIGGRFGHLLEDIPPGLNYSFFTEKMGHPCPIFAWRSKFSDFLYKADPDTPTRTIKAQGGQYTGPFHWDNRPFSVDELKRLQTFLDDYEIAGGRQVAVHQIGNSVPPQLARILATAILRQIFDVPLPFELPLLGRHEKLHFRTRKRLLTSRYRDKAKQAISEIKHSRKVEFLGVHRYGAGITNDFKWIQSKAENPQFYVESSTGNTGSIFVSNTKKEMEPSFSIDVVPDELTGWILPVPKVILSGYNLSFEVFQAVWKAFEKELIRHKLKADLVQLCGYYQYVPAFKCRMSFSPHKRLSDRWQVLKNVVQGTGVRRIFTTEELGLLWDVPHEHVFDHACFLRELGYEVRNRNTNPQIPQDSYLIPYSFPTLGPMSVQLRKSLEHSYAK